MRVFFIFDVKCEFYKDIKSSVKSCTRKLEGFPTDSLFSHSSKVDRTISYFITIPRSQEHLNLPSLLPFLFGKSKPTSLKTKILRELSHCSSGPTIMLWSASWASHANSILVNPRSHANFRPSFTVMSFAIFGLKILPMVYVSSMRKQPYWSQIAIPEPARPVSANRIVSTLSFNNGNSGELPAFNFVVRPDSNPALW